MPKRGERSALILVIVAASTIAMVAARPYAGSWNDGSRLATVESLVDHGTLAIDDSIFVVVPSPTDAAVPQPYRGPALTAGTLDKLFINGQFYSDKSPVPALLLAAVYQCLQRLFGLQVRLNPAAFCWCMTVLSSGVAYVVAVLCVFLVGRVVGLALGWRLVLAASLGLATVALVYVQHVNNHILLLGVAAALTLQAALLLEAAPWWRLVLLGSLAGLGYAIDLGAGPPLLASTGLLALWRVAGGGWAVARCGWVMAGALPWLALHHAVNYAVGGTLGPANAVPEYLNWEGCPFQGAGITGAWHHASLIDFAVYAVGLLFGKRGFIGHNLPLLLLLPAPWLLWRSRAREWPVLLWAAAWCAGTWLLYAAASRNFSGANLSIRWFVPLLAPAYYGLAVLLVHWPHCRVDLLLLSGWGAILMALAWWEGPWTQHMVPWFWQLQAAALVTWAWLAYLKSRARQAYSRRRAMARSVRRREYA